MDDKPQRQQTEEQLAKFAKTRKILTESRRKIEIFFFLRKNKPNIKKDKGKK